MSTNKKEGNSVQASVIVPSYKEAGNVKELVERVFASFDKYNNNKNALQKEEVELIFVDDNSRDGTEEEIKKLSKLYPVRIIVRTTERGLSSAVLRGFEEARGTLLLCMDADLQHPPEKVPDLLEKLRTENAEFVIGTRYGKGVAIDKNWPLHRRIISVGARLLSRPLTPLSDPMTGFFALRKDVVCILKQSPCLSPLDHGIIFEWAIIYRVLFLRIQTSSFSPVFPPLGGAKFIKNLTTGVPITLKLTPSIYAIISYLMLKRAKIDSKFLL